MQGSIESWEAPGGASGVSMAGVREEVFFLASRIEDQGTGKRWQAEDGVLQRWEGPSLVSLG